MPTATPLETPLASQTLHPALDALRRGRLVLVTDPVRPSRGGILAAAADKVSDDIVNDFVTLARGLVAVALPPERLERLGLALQGRATDDLDRENYAVSVEARSGVSTGISAGDRARTIQALADHRTRPADLSTPGHVLPALADPEGVVARPGWAEACIDLARIAGIQPCVAFCHVLDEEGELADAQRLEDLAREHGLPRVGVAAILSHRLASETFVVPHAQATLPTRWGDFVCRVFQDQLDGKQHLAFTLGDLRSREPVLVRLHSECLTGDVLGSLRCDCGTQLGAAMQRISDEGRGVLLYLRQEGRGIGLVNKLNAYALQEAGRDTVEANLELGFEPDLRDFGVGAQMLLAMGVQRIRMMTNNPRKVHDMTRYGLEVVTREPLEFAPCAFNEAYLRAKKEKLGHLLTKV